MSEEVQNRDGVADEGGAVAIAEAVSGLAETLSGIQKSQEDMNKKIEERSQVQNPIGAPGVRVGESIMGSRPFSMSRLAKAMKYQKMNDDSWKEFGKLEHEFASRVGQKISGVPGKLYVPISPDYMSDESGMSDLRKEWSDMNTNMANFDKDEAQWLLDRLSKTMSFRTHTSGGTLVDFPEQGELIDLLRNTSLFSQINGISEVQLPQQGAIHYPRVTSGVTISSYAEVATTSESTPGTDSVRLEAKKYAGLVKFSEEFMRFATSVAADAFVRQEMTKDINLKFDSDLIVGQGGTSIHGLVNYTGLTTHTATTTGANGDTLEAEDLDILYAKIADANAPVESGFFFAMRTREWAALKHRQDSQGQPVFKAAYEAYGGGKVQKTISGEPVYCSTNIPNNRLKSAGTDLTLVLAGVPSELYLGRAGAIEVMMTDSDGTDFQTGTFTMRGVHYIDAVPKHEASFGLIDQLVIG